MSKVSGTERNAGDAKAHKKNQSHKISREVIVVSCAPAFPISTKRKSNENNKQVERTNNIIDKQKGDNGNRSKYKDRKNKKSGLDWSQTAREIHALGASGFVGKQKRIHEDDQYTILTGRKIKKQQFPLPMVRQIRKKAEKREIKKLQEAKDAGIVLPQKITTSKSNNNNNKKENDKNFRVHGPSPSVGFMKNGIFRVKDKPK